MTEKKLISLVIPVFNEEENVDPLYRAVLPVMTRLENKYEFELLFTDNHSTDQTFEVIQNLAKNDRRIRAFRFSRNFGFQRSIFTGYSLARGVAAIQLDCDLQDPPELICEFIEKWEQGFRVVYGERTRRSESIMMNFTRKVFYRLINFLSEDKLPLDAGDFRLVDRRVIDELKRVEDYQPYLRGTIAALGFEQAGVPYERAERQRGRTHFTLSQLVGLALDGILNHSIVPLRIATYTGLVVSSVTFLGLLFYAIGKYALGKEWPPGFATLAILILGSLSLNALFLGIIGEYLGRIYQQVKRRPLTIVERQIGAP